MKAHQPALRGNEILTRAATWMNLGNMMLSEINQPQNDKYYTIPLIQGNQNRQIHGDKKQNSVISAGGGEMRSYLMGLIWDDEKFWR